MGGALMKEIYSLYISLAALVVSVFSLGWNFYRDVILKPRLRVTVAITNIITGAEAEGPFINVSGVNHGPGSIICNGVLGKKASWFPFHRKGPKYFYVMEGYDNLLSDRFPKKLEIGDSVNQFFPYNEESFLSINPSHIGLRDTFGRIHWASKKSLEEAKKQFLKEFKKRENEPR
jgi:hypothetical protein